jgi:hypothetical protein
MKINFDFKKLLLENGERIGLGVALGFMALLLLLGAWSGLGKKSPLDALRGNTEELNRKILQTRYDGTFTAPKGASLSAEQNLDPDSLGWRSLFQKDNPEDTKKRNPGILSLVDYQVQYLRVPLRVFETDGKQVMQMVVPKGGAVDGTITGTFAEKIRPARMVIVSATFPYAEQLEMYRQALRAKEVGDLKQLPEFLGLYIYRRTILPNGKVEYEKDDSGKDVEWKSLVDKDKRGVPPFFKILTVTPDIQPEDPGQKDFVMPGVTMPRPILAGVATYPSLTKLKGIPDGKPAKAAPEVAADSNAGADLKVVGIDIESLPEEQKNRLNGVGIHMFDPLNPFGKKEGSTTGAKFTKPWCLCRFIDVDVQPGKTYDYSIVIRAKNPNKDKYDEVAAEKYARAPELLSNYNFIPRIQIPYDVDMYVADEQGMDKNYKKESAMVGAELHAPGPSQVAVQIHRWVDRIKNQDLSTGFALGEWLVAERLLVRRGEVIGHDVGVDVPFWNQAAKAYFLAGQHVKGKGAKPNRAAQRGIVVDFTVKTEPRLPAALLVDFHGGRQPFSIVVSNGKPKNLTPDESAPDVLFLISDGKLAVQNGVVDTDPDSPAGRTRLERYEAWRDRIGKLKPQKGKTQPDIFGK